MARLELTIEKITELKQNFKPNDDENQVHKELEELNKQFQLMCEDWYLIAEEEERNKQRQSYYETQLAIHELGIMYVSHLLKKDNSAEQKMDTGDTAGDEINAETSASTLKDDANEESIEHEIPVSQKQAHKEQAKGNAIDETPPNQKFANVEQGQQLTGAIQYRELFPITRIIHDLRPINNVSKQALMDVIAIIDTVRERAEQLQHDIMRNQSLVAAIHAKLDSASQLLFEWETEHIEPDLHTMMQFLTKRMQRLSKEEEYLGNKVTYQDAQKARARNESGNRSSGASESIVQKRLKLTQPRASAVNILCVCCKGAHSTHTCETFKRMSVHDRKEFMKNEEACENCLSYEHPTDYCKGGPCKKCKNKYHNSLLCPLGYFNK